MRRLPFKLAPVAYLVVIIAFVLPWVGFSCGDQQPITVTGLHLIAGTTIELQVLGRSERHHIESESWALGALLLTFVGLGLSLAKAGKWSWAAALASLAALISLYFLHLNVTLKNMLGGMFGLHSRFLYGFWLACGGQFVAGALCLHRHIQRRREKRAAGSQ